jgi:hypothetical protein
MRPGIFAVIEWLWWKESRVRCHSICNAIPFRFRFCVMIMPVGLTVSVSPAQPPLAVRPSVVIAWLHITYIHRLRKARYNSNKVSKVHNHDTNGLHPPQTAALTPKLAKLPTARPATRLKLATVAAVSMSFALPCSRSLSFREPATIMPQLPKYPLVVPSKKTSEKKMKSELKKGVDVGEILQSRNRGTNATREMDRESNRGPEDINHDGLAGRVRPSKSPMFNRRK